MKKLFSRNFCKQSFGDVFTNFSWFNNFLKNLPTLLEVHTVRKFENCCATIFNYVMILQYQKLSFLTVLKALSFDFRKMCAIFESQISQNQEPQNCSKWHFLRLEICQNWFHVKSKWHENSEISTLWYMYRYPMM